MFDIQILNADITQLDVDCIICPIWPNLMPAYEVGEAIFAAAGYENINLQKTVLERFDKPSVSGVRVIPGINRF